MFSRAVRCLVLRRRATASGRCASSVSARRSSISARSGPDAIEVDVLGRRRRPRRSPSRRLERSSSWPSQTYRRARRAPRARCRDARRATTCSIFMASMTASCWPRRTVVAFLDGELTRRPCSGARDGQHAVGQSASACRWRRASALPPARRRARPADRRRRSWRRRRLAPRCCRGGGVEIEMRAVLARLARQRGSMSPRRSPVSTSPARTPRRCSRACRNAMLVGAPAMWNSHSAR